MVNTTFFTGTKHSDDPSMLEVLQILGQFKILAGYKDLKKYHINVYDDFTGNSEFAVWGMPNYVITWIIKGVPKIIAVPLFNDDIMKAERINAYNKLIDLRDEFAEILQDGRWINVKTML